MAPAAGERAVRLGLLPQAHLRGPERERIAVVVAVLRDRRVAEVEQPLAECVDAGQHQRAHGRHVERVAERGAHAHAALEVAVVVLRDVQAARRIEVDRRIVEQRRRRQVAALDRESVEKGLQGRARLPVGAHAVDLAGGRGFACRGDVGEHLAAARVRHQHRAVAHVARGDRRELARERVRGQRLDAGIERGRDPFARPLQQAPRELRREPRRGQRFARARQQLACGGAQDVAVDAGAHRRRAGARTVRHPLESGPRRRQQGGQHDALGRGQSGRRLAREQGGRRADALQFAAVAEQVEISLENLLLAPAQLQLQRGAHLAQLAPRAGPVRRARLRQQLRHLHRDRAGAAPAVTQQRVARGREHAAPVHAVVRAEATVLACDHGVHEGRRNLLERHPLVAAHAQVEALLVEHHAVAIEQPGLRRLPGVAHGRVIGHARRPREPRDRHERERGQRDRGAAQRAVAGRHRRVTGPRRSAVHSGARRTSRARTSPRRASPAAGTCPGC